MCINKLRVMCVMCKTPMLFLKTKKERKRENVNLGFLKFLGEKIKLIEGKQREKRKKQRKQRKEGKHFTVCTPKKGREKKHIRSETPAFERRSSANNNSETTNLSLFRALVLHSFFLACAKTERRSCLLVPKNQISWHNNPLPREKKNGTPLVRDGERHRETD